jgi:phospholipid-translocating ATPase
LLDAAKEVGYTFLDRNSDTIFLNILGRNQQYKLLQKLEFTADRKKMSVIVQDL